MNCEDLKKLKEELATLSKEEQIERNKYLKQIAEGQIYGPMVGYASIDKPWLKFFDNESFNALQNFEAKNTSMYEMLYEYAINHLNDVAFEYLGKNITYENLLNNIDRAANSLKALGVKKGNIIPIMLPNIPEARYLIYACSKMGAIANPIMPTLTSEDLKNIIKNDQAKIVFMMTGIEENLKDINVVNINPLRSSNGIFQVIYKLFKKDNYDNFLENGKYEKQEVVKMNSSDVALIEQTGGTTGLITKGVVITNQNIYASNYQLENGGFNFNEKDTLLDILLPSISYGAAFEHLTLCNGIKNYMIPTLVKEKINSYISKYKPNHIMMGPIHFEYIIKGKGKKDWKFIKNIVSGGDSMNIELENNANKKLRENNVSVPLEQGYGESECFGACACNHSEFVKEGSVGIPHLLTTISVFKYDENNDDYTTDEELTFGKEGEICISSPVLMKEYLNNEIDTSLVLKKHSDGTIWLHTGDVGFIDSEGYVFITERIKDLIFRNGFKVSPQKINNIILEKFKDYIDNSVVIGVPDKNERNVPVLFVKLKDDTYLDNIKEFVNNKFTGIEALKEVILIDDFPRTSVGKIDKKELRKYYVTNKENNFVRKLIKK